MTATSSRFLGIDTGGTFTDGVLFDPATGHIEATCKTPTTHHDLRMCIQAVLKQLVPDDAQAIQLVSLSTTLATNAIAEGKNRPVALFLLGYDQELVLKFRLDRALGGASRVYYVHGGHHLNGREQEPLDEAALRQAAQETLGMVEAFAVSGYAGVVNPQHEERAAQVLGELAALPVVQGRHLTDRIGSIRRAATAALNASLIPEAFDFMRAVQAMLAERGIRCPLVMVKGDGSLAAAEFAAQRPVEIIHSGPATSAIGGAYLAQCAEALVVDVGGTTTDLALVRGGQAILGDGEASVGGYQTAVRTIHARSFGLGGDSQLHFDLRRNLAVGPQRVTPLARLAHEYPEAGAEMKAWLKTIPPVLYNDRLEYWRLLREPQRPPADARTRRALELLRNGPQRVGTLLKTVGAVSPMLLNRDALVQNGVIARCALTPTDLLHVSGEYAPWDAEAAHLAVETAARLWNERPERFVQRVKDWIAERIAAETVQFLSGKPLHRQADPFGETDLGAWFFEENLTRAHPYLGSRFELKLPMVGIGAPARVFLPRAADILGAQIHFPEHFEVANAVGTVVGNVMIRCEAEVYPLAEGGRIAGYVARAAGQQRQFAEQAEALAFARSATAEMAQADALHAGADNPSIEVEEAPGVEGFVRLWARAIGKPGAYAPPEPEA